MSIALYMDEHVPRPITLGLRIRQVDVLTVQEDGYQGKPDQEILDRAEELQRVIFSQDEDFLSEANHRQTQAIKFSGVIYAYQRNIAIRECIRDLEILGKAANPEDLSDRIQYLPL